MKRLLLFITFLLCSLGLNAQYVVSDKYYQWFEDSGHEVITRKTVSCSEDYQDLWNGCYVRVSGNQVYIYEDGSSILYGEAISLLYNGYYCVMHGDTWYLADPEGNTVSGVYGKKILHYPWGYVAVQKGSGNWEVYHSSGRKVNLYSEESPFICYNGSWGVKHGNYWYAYDSNGNQINGVYGNSIKLLNNGRWKCIRGNYVSYIDGK